MADIRDDPDSCHARTQRGFCHINIKGAPARAVERARRDWTTHALFPNAENTRVSMSAVASTLNARVVARTRAPRARIASLSARTLVPHAVPARSVQSSSARAPPRAARAALESNPGESFDAGAYGEPVTFKFHDDGVSADVVHARTGRLLRVQSAKDWTSRVSASVAQRAFRSKDLAGDVVPFVAERESLPVVYYSFMHDGSSVEYDASHRQVRRRGVDGKTFVNNVVESAQNLGAALAPKHADARASSAATSDAAAPSLASVTAPSGESDASSDDDSNQPPDSTSSRVNPFAAAVNTIKSRASVAVDFAVNGKPREAPEPEPLAPSAQAWIDAWAAGAPKSELDAIKAASAPNDGSDALDLSAMETFGAGADARSRPDAVFVSDDEADQEAMSEVIAKAGSPGSRGAGFESSRGTTRAAFFDLDGTVARSNVVAQYAACRLENMPAWLKFFWVPFYLLKCVLYLIVDAFNRSAFNTLFARDFRGLPSDPDAKAAMAATVYDAYLRRNIFPAAARTLAELKSDGFDVVLVTGSIDFLVAPLARDLGATEVIANALEEKDGRFTGSLVGAPVADEEKRARVLAYAEKRGVDLAASRAFGDSIADVPMLECVGESFAVSPSAKLRTEATRRGWDVLEWTVDENGAEGNAGSAAAA